MRKPLIWLLALAAGLLVSPAFAQYFQNWWHVPPFTQTQNRDKDSSAVPVRQGTFIEWQRSIDPGVNGTWYFSWSATNYGIRGLYVSRVLPNGDTAWTRTVNDGADRQEDPVVLGTADGGVIVAWVDYRAGTYRYGTDSIHFVGDGGGSIMVQKLDSTGQRLWNVTGQNDSINAVPIAMVVGYQNDLRIITDGANGCFLFWEDSRNNLGQDIYGTRVLAAGTLAPGYRVNGNPVAVAPGNQPQNLAYTVDVDGRNGAWIAWIDNRNLNQDIYLQHMRANGTTQWDSNGYAFITTMSDQDRIKLAPDGRGGAFLIWRNETNGDVDLFMQRMDSTGRKMWTPDSGIAIGTWANEQTNPRIIYIAQDQCIISWEDFRNDPSGTNNEDIYVQKITGTTTMTRSWNANGVLVCSEVHHQRESRLCSDGTGGCILVWEDERTEAAPTQDSYAQRVNSAGSVVWDANGRQLAAFGGGQIWPICRESNGRLLFVWSDGREGSVPIYRTVWDLTGAAVGTMPLHGAKTIADISGNVRRNLVVMQGTTRVLNVWVDERRSDFGARVYYFQQNADNGQPVTTVKNGISVTIDSTNTVIQDGSPINSSPLAVSTPDSGAIVIYFNTVGNSQTLRAQKISYSGARMWGDFGVEVCGAVSSPDFLSGMPDGNGGVYFAYTVAGGAPYYLNEIRLQHIDATGARLLPANGTPIQPGLEQQWASLVVSGGTIFVGYIEVYDQNNNYFRVQLARMNANGTIAWQRTLATGADTSWVSGPTGNRSQLRLIPASNGSVVAYWMEFRFEVAAGSGAQIYAQKMDANNTLLWGTNGKRVGASTAAESDAVATPAGNSYWFEWKDTRDAGYASMYLQHLNENGGFMLDSVGIRLREAPLAQTQQAIVPDSTTGIYTAYIQYEDLNNPYPPPDVINESHIIGSHVLSNGTLNRPEIWRPAPYAGVSNRLAYIVKMYPKQYLPYGVPVAGGAIFNWQDLRSTGKEELVNLYVQRIRDDGWVGVREVKAPMPQNFSLQQNYPNPFNSTTVIRFAMPHTDRVKIAVYDVLGREVVKLLDEVKMTGTYEVRWEGRNTTGMKVASGVYFYQLSTPRGNITKKMTLLN